MSPTVVIHKDTGKVRLVVGAAGGTAITTATAYVKKFYKFDCFTMFIWISLDSFLLIKYCVSIFVFDGTKFPKFVSIIHYFLIFEQIFFN